MRKSNNGRIIYLLILLSLSLFPRLNEAQADDWTPELQPPLQQEYRNPTEEFRIADYRDDEFSEYLELEAGRGCPLRCTFCSTAPMWKRKSRAKSPERLLNEMTLHNIVHH